MPKLKSSERGDLYARVRVMIPEKLSERVEELVRQWAQLAADPRSKRIGVEFACQDLVLKRAVARIGSHGDVGTHLAAHMRRGA